MRIRIFALAAVVAVAAAACGGGSGGSAVLLNATKKTYAAGSAKVALDVTTASNGRTVHIRGNGAMDFAHREGRLDLSIPSPSGQEVRLSTIYSGLVIYMRSPLFGQLLPAAKPWLKLDLQELRNAPGGMGLSQAAQLNQSDPTQFLGYLRGSTKVKEIGHDTVRGGRTTHYRATIDLSKAAEHAPSKIRPEFKAAVGQLKQTTGSSTLPVDVWVDRQGRVAKESIQLRGAGTTQASATIDMELYDYGTSVAVNPPPAPRTSDLVQLIQGAQPSPSPTG